MSRAGIPLDAIRTAAAERIAAALPLRRSCGTMPTVRAW
jgi:hypothetical protein